MKKARSECECCSCRHVEHVDGCALAEERPAVMNWLVGWALRAGRDGCNPKFPCPPVGHPPCPGWEERVSAAGVEAALERLIDRASREVERAPPGSCLCTRDCPCNARYAEERAELDADIALLRSALGLPC